jgi:transposase
MKKIWLGAVLADIGDIIAYRHGLHFCAGKWIHIEIEKKFNLIHEKEWTDGESVSNICKRYGTSRKSYYKWKNRYKHNGMEGLADLPWRPHNIKCKKITPEVEETMLDLRITKRFGCRRIKFRLKRTMGLSLSTRTIYKMLKRHD